jgi:hypothetical protein
VLPLSTPRQASSRFRGWDIRLSISGQRQRLLRVDLRASGHQQPSGFIEQPTISGTQQPVISHFHQPRRQHVRQAPSDDPPEEGNVYRALV